MKCMQRPRGFREPLWASLFLTMHISLVTKNTAMYSLQPPKPKVLALAVNRASFPKCFRHCTQPVSRHVRAWRCVGGWGVVMKEAVESVYINCCEEDSLI